MSFPLFVALVAPLWVGGEPAANHQAAVLSQAEPQWRELEIQELPVNRLTNSLLLARLLEQKTWRRPIKVKFDPTTGETSVLSDGATFLQVCRYISMLHEDLERSDSSFVTEVYAVGYFTAGPQQVDDPTLIVALAGTVLGPASAVQWKPDTRSIVVRAREFEHRELVRLLSRLRMQSTAVRADAG